MLKIQDKTITVIKTAAIGGRMITDCRYRAVLFAAGGFAFNLAYALYNGALGIVTQSFWFVFLCAYYVILSTMRFSIVLYERQNKTDKSIDTEYYVMRFTGILLMTLSFVLAGLVYLSLINKVAPKYQEIIMITIATYTFSKITLAIINFTKVKKRNSPLLSAIRNIACADAAASILSLQRSMLVSFGNMESNKACIMNIITGAAVCLTVFMLGMSMVVKRKIRSDNKWQNQNL